MLFIYERDKCEASLSIYLLLTFFFLRFLEHEYLRNCPSDENIISGLGKVPLRFLYYDDIPDTSQLAFHRLPTGEELSGPKTYQTLMKYFATLDISPADLRERAWTRLNELYKQVRNV